MHCTKRSTLRVREHARYSKATHSATHEIINQPLTSINGLNACINYEEVTWDRRISNCTWIGRLRMLWTVHSVQWQERICTSREICLLQNIHQ